MSIEDLYSYIQGESQAVTRMVQYPSGTDLVYIRDPNRVRMAGDNIVIWDAETAGVALVLDTDYTLGHIDADLSTLEGRTIYGGFQILNVAYQGINLYIDMDVVGGYTTRPYRPTFETVTVDTTTVASSVDDSIFADATGGPITITLADGSYTNQRYSVVCTGGGEVTVEGAGLESASYSDIAVQFIWAGAGWLQLGGAGGGGGGESAGNLGIGQTAWFAGTGSIPYDKLNCDGTIYDIADYPGLYSSIGSTYGGDGITTFAVPNLQGITPGAFGTQDVNGNTKGDATPIGGVREDQIQALTYTGGEFNKALGVTAGATANALANYEPGTEIETRKGDYTRATELVGRWLIQAFDTVQMVPADPSIIKDWVYVYTNPEPQVNIVNSLPVTWGDGLYIFGISFIYQAVETRANGMMAVSVTDGLNRSAIITVDQAGSDSELLVTYDGTANTFGLYESGTDFTSLSFFAVTRWEDVAGEDSVLNPPVDGWETKVDDDLRTGPITNSWGAGTYDFLVKNFNGTDDVFCALSISEADIAGSDNRYSSNLGVASNAVSVRYDATANTFDVWNDGTWGGEITRLRKFNSLVNVVHSYNPNPLAIAQKDWVTKFHDYSNTGDVVNSWGDGKYIGVLRDITNTFGNTAIITVNNGVGVVTGEFYSGSSQGFATAEMNYDVATNTFTTFSNSNTYYIAEISRWEDSQATDAPKQVLADGWETVYPFTAIGTDAVIVNSWGAGKYEFLVAYTGVGSPYIPMEMVIPEGATGNIICRTTSAGANVEEVTVTWDSAGNNFTVVGSASWSPAYFAQIRKFTGLLRISANYNTTSLSDGPNQVQAINTDAGDVAITMPTSPNEGDLFEVWNTGTNGNHITGLPESIALGDGKGIRLRYVGGWRYEDVIIDEQSESQNLGTTLRTTKWSGGRMEVQVNKDASSIATITNIYPTPFVGDFANTSSWGASCGYVTTISATQISWGSSTVAAGSSATVANVIITGRWKAGS